MGQMTPRFEGNPRKLLIGRGREDQRLQPAVKKCLSETSTIRLGHFSTKSRLCGSEHVTKLAESSQIVSRRC